ncbi:COR domain-containing protein [Sciscionella marina]|uniref:COR domain-containing protein n=1 Tax=Sciscionella marina TaxID=508770 RepID=UPI00036D60D9|nr:COR domain-containing protein [Sciscionella marina]
MGSAEDEATRRIERALASGDTRLGLAGLGLLEIPDRLRALTDLRVLDIQDNALAALPEWITGLRELEVLHADGNELTALPDSLADLPRLTVLGVHGNPILSPPPEITAAGSDSVLEFLRARAKGSTAQWVSKLMVVGEGGVGKTSLVRALAEQPHDPHEPSTHGLRIEHLEVDHPFLPEIQMRLSAWDFGGQQIYHATHQFFLTNRSLFLLLWNSRLGWEQGKLRYWLDIITARAPESPVLLVATHTEHREPDLPLDELRAEYPNLRAHFAVDNASGAGIPQLHEQIAELAARLPLMGSEWPTNWLRAADAVREAPERTAAYRHVTPARLWSIMTEAGVTDPAHQHYIATALHQLGEVLYYDQDPELSQTVVLQPEWVNEYISKVLDSPEVAARKGVLSRRHLGQLWADLDIGMREHFLGMMDKYDLSYRIDDAEDVSLVVERLPWSAPDYTVLWEELGEQTQIRVRYQLNTMPPGIPTWFIARSHRFSTGIHWRTGALLRHTDRRHLALLRAHTGRNTVELTVRGPMPLAFFSILDEGLNRTLERFPGLRISRRIPCPCQDGTGHACDELYEYEDLVHRLTRDPPREEIECHKTGEFVNVRELLLGLAPSEHERENTRLDRIEAKLDQLRENGEYNQLEFLRLRRILQHQQETRCPSVFAIVPAKRRKLFATAYELHLYCEQPGAWHRLPEPEGCYPVSEPAEWLRKFGPYLSTLLRVLKHVAPLAGPILGMTVDQLDESLKADCEFMKELMQQVRVELPGSGPAAAYPETEPAAHAATDADFRALLAMLTELDPARRWGGLSRHTTPEGLTLYLCPHHLTAYEPATSSAGE